MGGLGVPVQAAGVGRHRALRPHSSRCRHPGSTVFTRPWVPCGTVTSQGKKGSHESTKPAVHHPGRASVKNPSLQGKGRRRAGVCECVRVRVCVCVCNRSKPPSACQTLHATQTNNDVPCTVGQAGDPLPAHGGHRLSDENVFQFLLPGAGCEPMTSY